MSKTVQKPIKEATNEDIRRFAAESLGIEIPTSASRAIILAKIQPVWDKPHITVTETEAPIVDATAIPKNQDSADDEKVEILIDRSEEAGGDEPVFASVNGRGIYIPRGEPAVIAARYVEVLQRAVKTVFHQVKGSNELIPREVPLYPFRILKRAA